MTRHDNDNRRWLKHEIEQFHKTRIEILHQMKFDDLIANRSVFFRSGEITNAGELVYHVLDEFMMEREEALFESLRQKLKARIPPDKIGSYVAMLSGEYEEEFNTTLNRFTHEFLKEYSTDGKIDWGKLTGL